MSERPRSAQYLAAAALLIGLAGCMTVDAPPRSVIFFVNQSTELSEPARGSIAEVVADAKGHPGVRITIRGYADLTVSQDVRALAARRAQVVADELAAEGVAPARITQLARAATRSEPGVESRRVEIEFH